MANTRREFLCTVSAAAAVGVLQNNPLENPLAASETTTADRPLGVALVGLGSQSTQTLFSRLADSPLCRINALVSSDAAKARAYADKSGISGRHIYTYDSFDKIADDASIDIVYIALPNAMHCEFAVRAAQAHKHVLCESPMAVSSAQCRTMIDACAEHSRLIAVASSPLPLPLGCFGHIHTIEASQALSIENPNSWRLDSALSGGGALLQAGIDVLRTQRLWVASDPLWVIAQETKTDAQRFAQVDESVTWSLGFAQGTIAHGAVSLNYQGPGQLKVRGQIASLSSAFPSTNHYWTRADQLETFAASIQGKPVFPDNRFNPIHADEALKDMLIAEAILRSIKDRCQVQLG